MPPLPPSPVDLASLLRSWDLSPDIVQAFVEQRFTTSSLLRIKNATIERLIPFEGPRSEFLFHFEQFKSQQLKTVVPNPSDCSTFADCIPSTSARNTSTLRRPPRKRTKFDEGMLQALLARPNVNELHQHLKESIPGLTVLGFYASKSFLDYFVRDTLAQEAIFKELKGNYNRGLVRDDFDKLSDSIVKLFPNEAKQTWYDVVTKNKRTVVEGKLRYKWYGVRRSLFEACLITTLPNETADNIGEDSGDDTDIDCNEELELLYNPGSSWPDIQAAWEATFRARKQVFKKECNKIINIYLDKFICLAKPLGWTLIAQDGEREQEALKSDIQLWDAAVPFLLAEIRTENPTFLSTNVPDDVQFLSIIRELPNLWRVRTVPKSDEASKSSKCYRPTQQEIVDSFLLHVQDISLIQEKLNARKVTLHKFKHQLQPVAVVVGSYNLMEIRQCFICVDNHRWEVPTPQQAVFGVFKLCFGLNARYPIESRHIWLFLQLAVFKFSTPQDYLNDRGLRSYLAARLKDSERFNNQ
ncbi:uncharacterized protein LOC127749764 [Frankliniella occidentalis]|uniref:Uncharacterized protein LOC113208310 n=1 Tax=Frankliniella occidentalis TaxID=133901 RepID=A0A6J1SRC5_FRAOC|nr:uncharacterized protein LOC113208310 [Frankliniella occidentalis]XP_052125300.1 uncharacterized protein LOC127749764 [Frankliniella occidentalis]